MSGALRRAAPWLPSIAYMTLIWALSSQSALPALPELPLNDKIAHFVEYAILGGLYAYAVLRTWPQLSLLRALAIAALLTSAWGYLDEIHQA
ncbi:MAG TPA: VanZ family protein, partial [Polyangiales bacterium]|nr:VanZ family protein [Polyangiales bacterium]